MNPLDYFIYEEYSPQKNLRISGTVVLKMRPKTTDMAIATPAVLARSLWEETSPINAPPRLPAIVDISHLYYMLTADYSTY